MATTRVLSGSTPGRSMVAFYGNAALRNQLLGFGTFDWYARLGSERGDRLLRESQLYKPGVHPPGLKGIELRDVQVSAAGESIDSIGGIIEASQLRLTVDNLPLGPARLLVYFSRASN